METVLESVGGAERRVCEQTDMFHLEQVRCLEENALGVPGCLGQLSVRLLGLTHAEIPGL